MKTNIGGFLCPRCLPAWWRLPVLARTTSSSDRPKLALPPGWKTPYRLRSIHTKKKPSTLKGRSGKKQPTSPGESQPSYTGKLRAYSVWKLHDSPQSSSPWCLRGLFCSLVGGKITGVRSGGVKKERLGRKKNFNGEKFYNFAAKSVWTPSLRRDSPEIRATQIIAAPSNSRVEENRSMRGFRRNDCVFVCFCCVSVLGWSGPVFERELQLLEVWQSEWVCVSVCVSRRLATVGVKVGGVEIRDSYRRLDLWINGPGFYCAFNCCCRENGCDFWG